MDYIIDIKTLDGKKSQLESIKNTSLDISNEFNSNLGRLSRTEISGIIGKTKQLILRLKSGIANSNSWYNDYIGKVNDLEESLSNFDVVDLTEPIEFGGEFIDMFGRVTMPIIKTGGDIHANAIPQTVIHNVGDLIVSESGYVFPFARGVHAPITSHVGLRTDPINGSANAHHSGTDIGVAWGTPIYAIAGGTVINAGRSDAGGYGNWVRIRQDDGNVVIYGHVSKSDYYSIGQRVEAGDHIANVGSEGRSTGPHLHLEMHDAKGNLLDSENYFSDVWK